MFKVNGLGSFSEPICAVIHLSHQPHGVVHQVVLDPDKIKATDDAVLIRLGEWPGDEARGWQLTDNIAVLAVLGRAAQKENVVTVTPLEKEEKGVS